MRDEQSLMKTVSAINPGIYSDDPAAIVIDRAGFDSVTLALSIGAGGITFNDTNRIDVILEHSDDGVNWSGFVADMTLPTPPFPYEQNIVPNLGRVLSVNAAHPATTVHRWGYVDGYYGERQYVRIRADFVGTHGTGTALSAVAILGHPRQVPVAA